MKVLQINSVAQVGSTGRMVESIHSNLQELGHQSFVSYGRGSEIDKENYIRIGNKLDNYLHVAKTRMFDRHGFGSKRATQKFIEQITKINPDMIHLHNLHGYYINVEELFAFLKTNNKPVVWTLHDCWSFTGHCTNFESSDCQCWHEGKKCTHIDSYPKSIFINNSIENYKRKKDAFLGLDKLKIITPSQWLKGLVEKSLLKEYQISVINNGIDTNTFNNKYSTKKRELGIENKWIILGVANVWTKEKGINYFLDMANYLSDNEVIILVGLDSNKMRNLPKNIIGIKNTKDINELAEYYSIADVFINPTLEDNFPTTNLEALACGTPVITFKTGGSPESLSKDSGIVVGKGDFNSLIKAYKKVKLNPPNKETCIKQGLKFKQDYTLQKYIKVYEELYSKDNNYNEQKSN